MKKYVIFILFFVFQSHAMEQVCYLNRMPCDILDYIASFLMETDEQFIARICVGHVKKQKEREKKAAREIGNEAGIIPILKACNIDRTKFLLFFQDHGELMLQDLDRGKGYLPTRYSYQEERERHYIGIGLSPRGRMFACYYRKYCSCEQFHCEEPAKYVLEIIKMAMQKKEDENHILILQESRELHRGGPLGIDEITFNKQGNKLIVYDSCADFKPTIFPLKIVDSDTSQAVVKPTNKLQEYFRDKFVCNQYIEGKK